MPPKGIKIYKNVMSEEQRLKCLTLIDQVPEIFFQQSDLTTQKVDRLKDFLPTAIYLSIKTAHRKIYSQIQDDFEVNLAFPETSQNDIISVDRRIAGSKLQPHNDFSTEDHLGPNRHMLKVTSVFYWNDDYSGGEINFPDKNFTYKPEAGDLLAFDPGLVHEVLEIKSGIRYNTQYIYNGLESD